MSAKGKASSRDAWLEQLSSGKADQRMKQMIMEVVVSTGRKVAITQNESIVAFRASHPHDKFIEHTFNTRFSNAVDRGLMLEVGRCSDIGRDMDNTSDKDNLIYIVPPDVFLLMMPNGTPYPMDWVKELLRKVGTTLEEATLLRRSRDKETLESVREERDRLLTYLQLIGTEMGLPASASPSDIRDAVTNLVRTLRGLVEKRNS